MSDNPILEVVNRIIMEAEGKLSDALKKNASEKSLDAIKGLIAYLREKQKEINKTFDGKNKNDRIKFSRNDKSFRNKQTSFQ